MNTIDKSLPFGTSCVCKETNNQIKNICFLNMIGRKRFTKPIFEQSSTEGERTSYLEKKYSRQRK